MVALVRLYPGTLPLYPHYTSMASVQTLLESLDSSSRFIASMVEGGASVQRVDESSASLVTSIELQIARAPLDAASAATVVTAITATSFGSTYKQALMDAVAARVGAAPSTTTTGANALRLQTLTNFPCYASRPVPIPQTQPACRSCRACACVCSNSHVRRHATPHSF